MSDQETPAGSPAVLEIDELLQPISDESPVGEDLREDPSPVSPYYQIKDARNGARAAERAALMEGEDGWTEARPFWQTVLQQGPEILKNSAKDLEIAAWMVEALVRAHGFPGMRDGFKLLKGLVDNFGENVYPLPDEDGIETRVAALTGLNGDDAEGTLIVPISAVKLTEGMSEGPYSAWEYQQALDLDRIADPEARQRRVDSGAVSMSMFQTAVNETSPTFFSTVRDDLAAASAAWAELVTSVDTTWGYDAPPTSAISKALEAYADTLRFVTQDILAPEGAEAAEGEDEGDGGGMSGGGGGGGGGGGQGVGVGSINTREDAFRELTKVADFFRKTEPHSPVSYALQQVVCWGRMPLPELLSELIADQTARDSLFKLTGMESPAAEAEAPAQSSDW